MLAKGLREQGYAVDIASDGPEALYQVSITNYDAVVLDVMLPGLDGFAVCETIRRDRRQVPVLMLTARDAVDERITGLDSGADDYLVKPFDFGELLARLRALIRRGQLPLTPTELTVGHLRLNLRARQAYRQNALVSLTSREYALLEFLAVHAGRVVGRGDIAEHVWDAPFESMSNVIDVVIQRVRRKAIRFFLCSSTGSVRVLLYRGKLKDYPKTEAGDRFVAVVPGLARELVRHRANTPYPAGDDPIFATGAGTHLSAHNVRRMLRPKVAALGLGWVTPHIFRHSLATFLRAAGFDAHAIAQVLGHADPSFTQRTYIHESNVIRFDDLDLGFGNEA